MPRSRMTLQRRVRLLVAGVALVLVAVLVGVGFAVARFRDDVNERETLIPASADAAELSGLLVDQLTLVDRPRGTSDVEGAELRTARQRAAVLVGRLERELADRPSLAADLGTLRTELLGWQTSLTALGAPPDLGAARAALTSMVTKAEDLNGAIADEVGEVAADARTSREVFVWSVTAAGAVAVLLLVSGAYALHLWVVAPVRRLAGDVASVAEGAHDLPITATGGRELEQLAASVARMRERILAERDRAVRAVEAAEQEAPAVAALRTLLAPRTAAPPPGLAAAGALLPAEGMLAGDWFDIATRGDELVVAIGDVCGHGVEAGGLAVRTKFALLDSIDVGLDPDAALDLAARRFGRDDTFVTALVVAIDATTGACRYASAGHNPALVVRVDGTIEELPRTGPLIGLADGPRPVARTALGPGDLLVAYTDGVVEARDGGGGQWEVGSLTAALLAHHDAAPDRLAELVLGAVLRHCGGRCTDDATVVVVRRDA